MFTTFKFNRVKHLIKSLVKDVIKMLARRYIASRTYRHDKCSPHSNTIENNGFPPLNVIEVRARMVTEKDEISDGTE